MKTGKTEMDIRESAENLLMACMDVKEGEQVLVVADQDKYDLGYQVYETALCMNCEALFMCMKNRSVSGEEPPSAIAAAMCASDVVICITEHSMTHTNARISAAKAGARIGTMPGITEEMFSKGAMTADFRKVEADTKRYAQMLTEASTARIEKDGHVLTLNLKGRNGVPSTGVYRNPGEAGNLPSGEAYIAPLEDGVSGSMVIDGSMEAIGVLEEPLAVTISKGRLKSLEGDGGTLQILFAKPENGITAELGIGTNHAAVLCGNILEDEKVYGTVHIAFGSNTSFGGTNKADCHMDGIILEPDLYLDDELIMKKGVFLR